jgi:hypothetical protein
MACTFVSHSSRDKEQAQRLLGWLCSQGFADTFLDFDKHTGIPPGADWERTLYREITRSEAVLLLLTKNWFDSKWCFAEFTQARALGKAIFPLIETPRGEVMVSPDIQHLDLIKDREGGLERLGAELTRIALNSRGGFAWDGSRPPYPGMLAFDEADAAIYFGRDDDIRRLIERLNARRSQGGAKLVLVLGASGSGKSSLLRAGVLPQLKLDRRNWLVLPPFRPQFNPLDELAQALATGLGSNSSWQACRHALDAPDLMTAFSNLARQLRNMHGGNEAQILITIDQAEELFGISDPKAGQQFLKVLNSLLDERLPFLVVMALRSDYLGALQSSEGITAPFSEFSLMPMPLARIHDVIKGPARISGLEVDDELILTATADAATDDALPLLGFALRELYDRFGTSKHLTIEAYRALGDRGAGLSPLENAVRNKADQVWAEAKTTPEDLEALKQAFVPAMVRVNAEGEYARRPASMDALPLRARPLLERLVKARLLVVRSDGNSTIVEVAHEALLRKWPLLRAWLDEERNLLGLVDSINRAAIDWEREGHSHRLLVHRGDRLSKALMLRRELWFRSVIGELGLKYLEEAKAAQYLDTLEIESSARLEILAGRPLIALLRAYNAHEDYPTEATDRALREACRVAILHQKNRVEAASFMGSGPSYLAGRWKQGQVFSKGSPDGRFRLIVTERGKDGGNPAGDVYLINNETLQTRLLQVPERLEGRVEDATFDRKSRHVFVTRYFNLLVYDNEGEYIGGYEFSRYTKSPIHLVDGYILGRYVLAADSRGGLWLADINAEKETIQVRSARAGWSFDFSAPDAFKTAGNAAIFSDIDESYRQAVVVFESGHAVLLSANEPGSATITAIPDKDILHAGFLRGSGSRLVTATKGGNIVVWEVGNGVREMLRSDNLPCAIESVDVSEDGNRFAAIATDQSIYILDALSLVPLRKLNSSQPQQL